MEFPFFSNNYWNHPHRHWAEEETPAMNPRHWAGVESSPSMNRQTRSPSSRQTGMEIPTRARNQSRTQLPKAASKVVDIPVHFVDSTRSEAMKATAAVKIQKVFRGLLVRKSMKKIDGIRKEVDEIEKRVSEKETILLMRRDAKERLKVNEMLMKLLLRLDSIRGVDSGVRVFRKSVIKKAIMLQEKVDEIVSGVADMVDTGETVQQEEECGAEVMKLAAEPTAEVVDQTIEIKGSENVVDEDMKANNHVESEHHNAAVGEEAMVEEEAGEQASELQHFPEVEADNFKGEAGDQASELQHFPEVEAADNFKGEAGDQASELQHFPEVEAENFKREEEDLMDVQQQSELIQVEGGGEKKAVEENGSSNRDLMERLVKGNEVLTGLVAELCERQESQSRILSSLSQRVENLEKAFRSDRSKRKKRNNNKL